MAARFDAEVLEDAFRDYARDAINIPPGAKVNQVYITDWCDSPSSLTKYCNMHVSARGSFFWRNRYYGSSLQIDYIDVVIQRSSNVLATIIQNRLDVACRSLSDLLHFEYENWWGRFLAFGRDWCMWSDARWNLVDKYMEPVR